MHSARLWLCLCLLGICIHPLYGQEKLRVVADYEQADLDQVLLDLESRYALSFAYDVQLIKGISISTRLSGLPLREAMKHILADTPLDFRLLGNGRVMLIPQRTTALSQQTTRPRPSLQGYVRDAQSGGTLPAATLEVLHRKLGAVTNDQGRFVLYAYLRAEDTILIRYYGYHSQKLVCSAIRNPQKLAIYLEPAPQKLADVLITEGTEQTIDVADGASEVSIDPAQIGLLSGLGEPDIFQAMQLLPGVSSGGQTGNQLFIRGSTPGQNLVLLDGITVYQPAHFFGLIGPFNNQAVNDVTLYRGGLEANYGGRVAGVVDVTGKSLQAQEAHGGISLNLMNANAYAELPVIEKKGTLMLAGRRAFTDVVQSGLFQKLFSQNTQDGIIQYYDQQNQLLGGIFDIEPSFHFYDLNAKLTFRPSKRDFLSVSFYKGGDRLDYDFVDDQQPNYIYESLDQLTLTNQGLSVNWSRQWQEDFYSKVNLAYSGYRNDYFFQYEARDSGGNYLFGRRQHNALEDLSLRLDHIWQVLPNWKMEFGIHSTGLSIRNRLSIDDTNLSRQDTLWSDSALINAAYLQHQVSLSKALRLNVGLRYVIPTPLSQQFVEPRLSLQYQLAPRWNLKAAWGVYHQFLNQIQANNGFQTGEEFWTLADGQSQVVTRAQDAILGLAYRYKGFLFDVELYRKGVEGVHMYTQRFDPILNQIYFDSLLTNGQSTIYGMDVFVQQQIGAYTTWVSYSYGRVKQQFEGLNEGAPFPAGHDQRHRLNWTQTLRLPKWELSGTFHYATGRPYTEAIDLYGTRIPGGTDLYFLVFGPTNARRLPAFQRLDVSAAYRWQQGKSSGSLGLSVLNALGRSNLFNRRYSILAPTSKGEPPQIMVRDQRLLGFTPNVFVTLSF